MMSGLPYDIAHLLDGGALVMAFALLVGRQTERLIGCYAAQSCLVAAATAWHGWMEGAADLFALAVLSLAAKGIGLPMALRWLMRRLDLSRHTNPVLGRFSLLVLGVMLVALSMLVVLPNTGAAEALLREGLALALSVTLLGLLMMITRRSALNQTIGFLALENGLALAAATVPGLPMLVEISAAALVLVATMVLGLFMLRIQQRFKSLDVMHLDKVGISHR